jgi:hypothetical protein
MNTITRLLVVGLLIIAFSTVIVSYIRPALGPVASVIEGFVILIGLILSAVAAVKVGYNRIRRHEKPASKKRNSQGNAIHDVRNQNKINMGAEEYLTVLEKCKTSVGRRDSISINSLLTI